MNDAPQVLVAPDAESLARAAATRIALAVGNARTDAPRTLALAGGSTPRATYAHLARLPVDWSQVIILFGDERCVGPDDPASNYHMARGALLDHIDIPAANVHRIVGELGPERAAARAEADLRAVLGGDPVPPIDVVLLGIGADGHTASLFPGAPELRIRDRLAVPVHRPDLPQPWRVSMTLPLLQAARQTILLADDAAKAGVVSRAIAGDPGLPAGVAHAPGAACIWMITRATARDVPEAQQTPLPSA